MNVKIDKTIGTPYYWQLANLLKEKIIGGEIPDGAILPSERTMADMAEVHRNTVIKAYNLLKDENLVESYQGTGYFVTYRSKSSDEPDMRLKVNWSNLIKDRYQDMEFTFDDIYQKFAKPDMISLATGMAPAVYYEHNIENKLSEVLTEAGRRPSLLSPYQGDIFLRKEIVRFLRRKGIKAETSELQIVTETNQALDFIISALLEEGDRVLIEEPVSPDVYRVFDLAGCVPVTVPVDENGMECDHLEAMIEKHRPKLLYVNSAYHDPAGCVLSLGRRKKIIELSNKYRLPVVEDDATSELSFDGRIIPAIKTMDKSENVIYIYSFSMTFIPGITMAVVLAPPKLSEVLAHLISVKMISLDWMTQKLLACYMHDGEYDEKVNQIRQLNKVKCDIMCRYLDQLRPLGVKYMKPQGGVYLWCRLPEKVNCRQVLTEALKKGVSVIPGTVFYPKKNGGQSYIRLNFSYEPKGRIEEGMKIMIEIIKELAH